MPWGRLDDSLYDHPKLDQLPSLEEALATVPGDGLVRLAAVGLWTRTISWCNRFLTDGHVPRNRIAKLDGSTELADLLVAVGLFEKTSTGYLVHDFLQFNDSRDVILERRAKDAQRKAEWRKRKDDKSPSAGSHTGTPNGSDAVVPRGVTPSVPPGLQPESHPESQRLSRDSHARSARESRPVPTRPDPSESVERDTTPQPPASGGRMTRRRAAGPMRSPTNYDDLLERDDDLSSLFEPEPAEVPT